MEGDEAKEDMEPLMDEENKMMEDKKTTEYRETR